MRNSGREELGGGEERDDVGLHKPEIGHRAARSPARGDRTHPHRAARRGAMGDSVDDEIAAAQQSRGVGLTSVSADDEFYGGSSRAGLATSIAAGGEAEEDEGVEAPRKRQTFTAPQHLLNDIPLQEAEDPAAAKAPEI